MRDLTYEQEDLLLESALEESREMREEMKKGMDRAEWDEEYWEEE